MASFYTSKLCEGEQSFKDFVLQCARAIDYLLVMRDDSADAPTPEGFQPSSHYRERLLEAKQELRELSDLSLDEAAKRAEAEHERRVADWKRSQEKVALLRGRLEEMLERVQGWQPPSADHQGLKDFMVEQLKETIRLNATSHGGPSSSLSPREWKAERLKTARRMVEYCREEHLKEVKRTESRNRWVGLLRESLKKEPS